MKVVILGCGRMGSTIAANMSRNGHDITIMDQDPGSFRRLPRDFAGKKFVGNGIDADALRKANLESADAFIALTNGDNRNIMSVQIAKVQFNVPKVLARIYDPIRAAAYAEMGIETICTTCIGAGIIQDRMENKDYASVEQYCSLYATQCAEDLGDV